MKILFPLGAFYPSQVGGPCNTLFWHTCALKSNGIDNSVLTTDIGITNKKIDNNAWSQKACGEVYYSKRDPIFFFKSLIELAKALHDNDIIHLNSLFNFYSIYSFIYIKLVLRNKGIVWSVRGELNSNALIFSKWKKKTLLVLYKLMNKNILYHSTSPQETEGIRKIFPNNKIVEIPNLIQPYKRLNLQTLNQLVFVGRIHPIKGIHKLIEALAKSQYFLDSDFKLVIVGKHEERHHYYKKELEALVNKNRLSEKIKFKGHIEGLEKENIYASSYALILPSETENFGNVVVESLNQGTPVIASTGTPWGILKDYNCGYHVSNEPFVLVKSIEKILKLDESSYNAMRINSKKLVDEHYNVNTQIYNWINIYKELSHENQK